jgi:hypothetical protein
VCQLTQPEVRKSATFKCVAESARVDFKEINSTNVAGFARQKLLFATKRPGS